MNFREYLKGTGHKEFKKLKEEVSPQDLTDAKKFFKQAQDKKKGKKEDPTVDPEGPDYNEIEEKMTLREWAYRLTHNISLFKEAMTVGGYKSPEPGNLGKSDTKKLAKVYAGVRKGEKGDSPEEKEKAAKIAWSVVNKEKESLKEYITGSGNEWKVHAEDGKVLGTHSSKTDADKQLQAIEISKHKKEGFEDEIKKMNARKKSINDPDTPKANPIEINKD